jgi:hypothetical protein
LGLRFGAGGVGDIPSQIRLSLRERRLVGLWIDREQNLASMHSISLMKPDRLQFTAHERTN